MSTTHRAIKTALLAFLGLSQYILVSASDVTITPWMIEMLEAVNAERAKEDLPPLCYNEKIILAAEAHNMDMIENDFFSHTGSDGSSPGDRITTQGYPWNSYGENIARGQQSVSGVMNSWMNSPGHKANILRDTVTHFGAAMTFPGPHWTQVFARSSSSEEDCMGPPNPGCTEDGSAIIFGRVGFGEMLTATCAQLAANPEYIDSVCSLVPRDDGTTYAPENRCPQTCGAIGASESPSTKVLALIERNGKPIVYEKTCGWIANQKPAIINKACNLDLSLWDDYTASSQCCETCLLD